MAKMTEHEINKLKQQFQKLTAKLIPLIDDFMSRNKEVTSLQELSDYDLIILDTKINGAYFLNYNFIQAIEDGLIDNHDASKIKAFIEWDQSLGGSDS